MARLPLPIKTSYAWAEAVHGHGEPEQRAGYKWRSGMYPGEEDEPAYQLAFGSNTWLKRLVERGLDTYACRMWLPMLRALES